MVLKGGLKNEVCQGQVHRHGARQHRPKEVQEKVEYEYPKSIPVEPWFESLSPVCDLHGWHLGKVGKD